MASCGREKFPPRRHERPRETKKLIGEQLGNPRGMRRSREVERGRKLEKKKTKHLTLDREEIMHEQKF